MHGAALLGGAVLADARLAALDHTGPRSGWARRKVHAWLIERTRRAPSAAVRPSRRVGDERYPCSRRARVALAGRPHRGRRMTVDGMLEALRPADAWLVRATSTPLSPSVALQTVAGGAVAPGCFDRFRKHAEATLDRGLPPPQAALLRGLVLRARTALAPTAREDLQTSGSPTSSPRARAGQRDAALRARLSACRPSSGSASARGCSSRSRWSPYVPLASRPSMQRAAGAGRRRDHRGAGRPASRWPMPSCSRRR